MVDDAPMTRADVVKERRHRVYKMLPVDDALIVLMTRVADDNDDDDDLLMTDESA